MSSLMRWFSLGVVIFGFVGILLFIVGPATGPGQDVMYLMGGSFVLVAFLMILGNRYEENFKNTAIEGEAIILGVKQTEVYVNNQPLVKFKLKVMLPGQEPYEVECKKVVNQSDACSIVESAKVQVLVDPRNKKEIEIV